MAASQAEHRTRYAHENPEDFEETGKTQAGPSSEHRELSGELIFHHDNPMDHRVAHQDDHQDHQAAADLAKTTRYRTLEHGEITSFLTRQDAQNGQGELQNLLGRKDLSRGEVSQLIDRLDESTQKFSASLGSAGLDEYTRERAEQQVRQACFNEIASLIPQEDNQHRLMDAILRENEAPEDHRTYGERVLNALSEQGQTGWQQITSDDCRERLETIRQERLEHTRHLEQNQQEEFKPERMDPVEHPAELPRGEPALEQTEERAVAGGPRETPEEHQDEPAGGQAVLEQTEAPELSMGRKIWRTLWGKPEGWIAEYPAEQKEQEIDRQIEKIARWAEKHTVEQGGDYWSMRLQGRSHLVRETRDMPPEKEFLEYISDRAGTGRIPEDLRERLMESTRNGRLDYKERDQLMDDVQESITLLAPEFERLEIPRETFETAEQMAARAVALRFDNQRQTTYHRTNSGNFNQAFQEAENRYYRRRN